MYTASMHTNFLTREFAQLYLNVPEWFRIMTDSHKLDVVTFDFEGTGVRCIVCGSNDYPMNFTLMHNVANSSKFVIIIFRINRH